MRPGALGLPHPPAPSPAAGEGEKVNRGRAKPSAGPPGLPRRGGIPTGNPLSGRTGRRGATGRGKAKLSPGPPNCRDSAASRRIPPPVSRRRGRGGLGGEGGSGGPGRETRIPLSRGYLPLSGGGGRGGEVCSGEGQALPRTPGLPRRGRFRTETSPAGNACEGRGLGPPTTHPALPLSGSFPNTCHCQSATSEEALSVQRIRFPRPAHPGRRARQPGGRCPFLSGGLAWKAAGPGRQRGGSPAPSPEVPRNGPLDRPGVNV